MVVRVTTFTGTFGLCFGALLRVVWGWMMMWYSHTRWLLHPFRGRGFTSVLKFSAVLGLAFGWLLPWQTICSHSTQVFGFLPITENISVGKSSCLLYIYINIYVKVRTGKHAKRFLFVATITASSLYSVPFAS